MSPNGAFTLTESETDAETDKMACVEMWRGVHTAPTH